MDAVEKLLKAIALHYDHEGEQPMSAPKVIAKGEGYLARRIMDKSKELGIPLYHDPDLTELLVKLEIGEEIPEDLYQVVAEILVFVYRLDKNAKER
ncbi:EscU/YscU/HrcU family type III secretion system export apparatus switch protein [Candidatus Riflebacteria bacterium]